MIQGPRRIALEEWDARYSELRRAGMVEPPYGGPLRRHVEDGDVRLLKLWFDDSAAALRLWNFLLTEEDRLRQARALGRRLVGAMKDLGVVPVMAYSSPRLTAFYPDGAWWIPCMMELGAGLLRLAAALGLDESFCPVRAVLGAFLTGAHFPIPDLLTCSVGATCDDFSAVAQRLNGLGYPILWWEIPARRKPDPGEPAVDLPGGFSAPRDQVAFVGGELERVRSALEALAGEPLNEERLSKGIREANRVRRRLARLRRLAYAADPCPLPALEMLIAEMLAIHFCSDREETVAVLDILLEEVGKRVQARVGALPSKAVRVFWVNPVADLRAMNLLEDCGARLCGTDFMFGHALDLIPEQAPPMEALARMARADPMVGSAADRADRVCAEMRAFGAEALVVSRIPGASHCATEGRLIAEIVEERLGVPTVEIEVPPVCDALTPNLRTRLEALVEAVRARRGK